MTSSAHRRASASPEAYQRLADEWDALAADCGARAGRVTGYGAQVSPVSEAARELVGGSSRSVDRSLVAHLGALAQHTATAGSELAQAATALRALAADATGLAEQARREAAESGGGRRR